MTGVCKRRDFKLARVQMFYFDEAPLAQFSQRAGREFEQEKP
jgi:hypothetical protein